MVQIVGKYEHERNENFQEYLQAVGASSVKSAEVAAAAENFAKSKPVLEVQESGDTWTILVENEGKSATTSFKLGETYDETMPHGVVLKSVTTRDGNKFITQTELPGGNKSIRTYEFTDSGIIVHLSDEKTGTKAKRYYKRL